MNHAVSVATVPRRLLGLPRTVTIVTCACGWRFEAHDPHTAATWTRHHREGRA